MNQIFWQELLPNWLSSIGTIGAVLIALFQKPLASWIHRPKISVDCNDKTPYVETITNNADSSICEKGLKIRVKVENTGKITADKCSVNIDCIYEKREKDDLYCRKEFLPIQLRDFRNTTISEIAPHLVYLIDVATIQKSDQMSSSDDPSQYHQFYKLFLFGNKEPMNLGKGTFIIPIKICSPNIETYIGYLHIYWDSDVFTTEKKHFSVKMLSGREFNNIRTS